MKVEPYSYRFFSRYMGPKPYIIPEDIGHSYLEYHLNPVRYRDYYADKNTYDIVFNNKVALPETIARRMDGGCILDSGYNVLTGNEPCSFGNKKHETLVLKPTIDSDSGHSVILFQKQNHGYIALNGSNPNAPLTRDFLLSFGDNWILQEGINQHKTLAFFNDSSVNTLRLCTYRSVIDNKIHVSSAAMRIGVKGSKVDNLHAGGRMVKINLENGKVGDKVYDQYGKSYKSLNEINFEDIDVHIPSWNTVIGFAQTVAGFYKHSRLLALDISLDSDANPVLIEVNNCHFSFWIPMMLDYDVFCGETEAVIDYCIAKEKQTMKDYKISLV